MKQKKAPKILKELKNPIKDAVYTVGGKKVKESSFWRHIARDLHPPKKRVIKYQIESTEPGFKELELALFKANDKIGWKSLTAFIVQWTNKHQPKDNYTLKSWMKK